MHSSLGPRPPSHVCISNTSGPICATIAVPRFTLHARTHAPALCNQCDPKCDANNVSTHRTAPRHVSLLPYITSPGCDPPPLPLFLSLEFCRTGIAQLVTCHL